MIALALACQIAVAPAMPAVASADGATNGEPILVAPSQSLLTDRKTLPAAMSLVVPGSGQLMQGRFEKGALHLGAATLLGILMIHGDSQQANVSGAAGSGANVRMLSGAALLGLALWSPLDAWLFGANDHHVD